jgi:cell division protein FtsW
MDSTPASRHAVPLLCGAVAALTAIGLVMVLSASSVTAFARYGSSFTFFERQAMYAGVGALAAFVVARVDHRRWQRAWAPLLLITLILLAAVLDRSIGTEAGGSARWIDVGSYSIQPSELAKLVVVVAAAAILSRHLDRLDETGRWAVPLVSITGLVVGLIMLQPDFGTAMLIALSVLVLLFAAGVRLRLIATSVALAVGAGAILILNAGYRKSRFLSFLHPWSDPRNSGYQIVQSLIALGSGHVFGVGLGASRQKWMYMPNAHTDFIFSILGEELGLVGETVVLALFGVLVYAGIKIAMRAPDGFGRLLAAGITGWLALQAVVNLGGATGVLPITGVPLPFVSFGGSSLIVSLVAMGALVSIARSARSGPAPPARSTPRIPPTRDR